MFKKQSEHSLSIECGKPLGFGRQTPVVRDPGKIANNFAGAPKLRECHRALAFDAGPSTLNDCR
jgi:hypothetical protein